jgi:acyl carrier protein phosphodiesterase
MVHGNNYGIEYVIFLEKPIDYFDDFLPICIDTRKMFKLDKVRRNSDFYKLVIINDHELDKRFSQREHIQKYMRSLDYISYNHLKDRTTHPEEFKYYDVKMYNKYIKYSDDIESLPVFSQTQLEQLEQKMNELSNKYNEDDYWEKYTSEERKNFDIERQLLNEVLTIQRIISNSDYFTEIKKIYDELTNIELTEEEKQIINKVLTHPKLEGNISNHGFNLIDYYT